MSLLDTIEVASPCAESWEAMAGDEFVRHCCRCDNEVYNLSSLPDHEALALLERAAQGERICARFRKRADGRLVTTDCPSRLRSGRRSSSIWRAAAALLTLVGAGLSSGCQDEAVVVGEISPVPVRPQVAPVNTRVAGGRRLPQVG
ncbi:MAG: hypothetical protein JKY65_05780 [Planctomycetes bacterium]|nr:hypothetical protein [Planctomycetota bacterium]